MVPIRDLALPSPESVSGLLGGGEELPGPDPAGSFVEALVQRRALVIDGQGAGEPLAPLTGSVAASAEARAATLDSEAAAIDASVDDTQRRVVEGRARDLSAREALAAHLDDLLDRREHADRLRGLRRARSDCDTTSMSRYATELRRQFVTRDYADRLRTEAAAVGLGYLPLRIDDRTEHGVSYIRVALDAPASPRNREVLSDGEYRGLALACFLAELSDVPGHSGIVVDDPVSSLDQARTIAVARRLVREAADGRQVIVFTHDLVFLEAIRAAASATQVPYLSHWLTRGADDRPGVVRPNQEPWQVRKVRTRLGDLRQSQAQLARPQDRSSDSYRQEVTAFYAALRETWERLVEELLLNDVVGRFQVSVATQRLKGVEVGDPDYAAIFHAMARVSTFSDTNGLSSPHRPSISRRDARGYH